MYIAVYVIDQKQKDYHYTEHNSDLNEALRCTEPRCFIRKDAWRESGHIRHRACSQVLIPCMCRLAVVVPQVLELQQCWVMLLLVNALLLREQHAYCSQDAGRIWFK